MRATSHPTKEQVRSYMQLRTQLRDRERCPPPQPEEIRRQLGWHHETGAAAAAAAASSSLLLPGAIAQLATLMAVEWCFLASGIGRPH